MGEVELVAEVAAAIVESLVDEAVEAELSEEIIAALTEIQNTISEDIITAVNEEGISIDDALTDSYNRLYAINEDLAEEFVTQMEQKGYSFGASPEEAEVADFEDTSPESDPNKGDVDTIECEQNPESPACLEQQGNKLSRFWDYVKTNVPGALGFILTNIPGILGLILVLYLAWGWIAIKVCELWYKLFVTCVPVQSPDQSPPTSPNTQNSCAEQNCTGSACKATSSMIQTIRKYMPFIIIPLIIIGLFFIIYFRSITISIIFVFVLLFILSMNTILGNLLATIVCSFNASYCTLNGKPINC